MVPSATRKNLVDVTRKVVTCFFFRHKSRLSDFCQNRPFNEELNFLFSHRQLSILDASTKCHSCSGSLPTVVCLCRWGRIFTVVIIMRIHKRYEHKDPKPLTRTDNICFR